MCVQHKNHEFDSVQVFSSCHPLTNQLEGKKNKKRLWQTIKMYAKCFNNKITTLK